VKDVVRLIVVLTLFGVVAGLMLAFTNKVTSAPIAKARQAEQVEALAEVLPAFDNNPSAVTNLVTANGAQWVFYVARKAGVYAGAAFVAESARGYGGLIRLMVGVRADGTVNRVRILSHQETPGLGSKIGEPAFKDQFNGRRIDGTVWKVKKDGGDVQAVTGATISSRAVAEALGAGLDVYRRNADAIARTGAAASDGR
jgi:Na+-translocating ferredoxin:NAD+ oxidoreductase subunit G